MKKIVRLLGLIIVSGFLLTGCVLRNKEYTITFNTDGGTIVENQTIKKGEKVTNPEKPEKEGYLFDGWYLDLNDEKPYDFTSEVTKSFDLYAKWVTINSEEVITLTLDTNGAEDIEPLVFKKGDSVDLPLPTRDGYTFVGWYSGKIEITGTISITTNMKLTAKWKKAETLEKVFSLNKRSAALTVGGEVKVVATIPEGIEDKTVTWTSSNDKVATVKNGVITAVGEGTAKITATNNGKSQVVNVTVKSKDTINMEKAKSSITAKTITGTTTLSFSSDGCTIKMIDVTVNDTRTKVTSENITTLYRPSKTSYIVGKYEITCGNLKETKEVKHTISPSTYKYQATSNGMSVVLKIDGAKDYVLSNDNITNVKYNSSVDGAQLISGYTSGAKFDMIFNNNKNVIYEVVSK